jgi:hypothetical protein
VALRHSEFTSAGAAVAAIDIDSPPQHAAMAEKLNLNYPFLSDPDRSGAIAPFDLANEVDPRNLAIPATVVIDAAGEEVWRLVSRDFADRPVEDDALEVVKAMDLGPVDQPAPGRGVPEPGPSAMPFGHMKPYFRGAKFAARAMSMRVPAAKDESIAYGALMDRYMEDVTTMYRIMRDQAAGD